MRFTLLLLTACAILCSACQQQRSATPERPSSAVEDTVFQKKFECGKLLAKIEGSELGPDIGRKKLDKDVFPLNPVVFYSPSLNTCVYIRAYRISGRTVVPPYEKFSVEHVSAEDLLTGRTIEEDREFNLLSGEAKAASDFEDEIIKRYGESAIPRGDARSR